MSQVVIKRDWSLDACVGYALAEGIGLPRLARIHENKRILGRNIDERSPRIDTRKDFGHWECDLILGHKTKDNDVLGIWQASQVLCQVKYLTLGHDKYSLPSVSRRESRPNCRGSKDRSGKLSNRKADQPQKH